MSPEPVDATVRPGRTASPGRVVDIVGALTRLGGAATVAELAGQGVSGKVAAGAVRVGTVDALGRGAVALPGCDPVLARAVRSRSWLTCVSVLAGTGFPLLVPPARPHLATTRAQPGRDVCWHRSRDCPTRRADPRTRSVEPEVAVVAALRCLPRREALVVADAALRRGLVTRTGLRAAVATHDRSGARWVVDRADGRAESVIESALRFLLLEAGLTDLVPQARLPGVGRVDLLLDGCLVVEADGFEHHSARADFLLDRQRLDTATETGHLTLRFGYQDVVHHPDRTLRCVQRTRALLRDGWFRTVVAGPGPDGPG